MNDGDGGLAKHAASCPHEIDWENAKIVGKETGWTQRIFLEGIETLRRKNKGRTPLNAYNKMEQWQSVLYSFFDSSIWRQIEDFTRKTSVTEEHIVNDIHSFKIKPEDGGNNTPLKIRKIKKRYSFAYSTKKFYKNQIDTWQWTKDVKVAHTEKLAG